MKGQFRRWPAPSNGQVRQDKFLEGVGKEAQKDASGVGRCCGRAPPAAHYRYEPRPVAVARGNEKGRVERAIRFVRDAFFAARTFADLDDLNAQADAWCRSLAADRRCPEDQTRSVGEVFAEEAPRLLKRPDNPYSVVEQVIVKVGKTPYVRFDQNDYSVPHTRVQRPLTVLADADRLRIVEGQEIVATHSRSYDKGKQIEDQAHV